MDFKGLALRSWGGVMRVGRKIAAVASMKVLEPAETDALSSRINDWASLLNNAVWSGGLVVAVQVIKVSSKVGGVNWFAVSFLQAILIGLALLLGFSAIISLIDRTGVHLAGNKRFAAVAAILFASLVAGWGMAIAVVYSLVNI